MARNFTYVVRFVTLAAPAWRSHGTFVSRWPTVAARHGGTTITPWKHAYDTAISPRWDIATEDARFDDDDTMRTLVRHQHDTLIAPIWRLCSTVPGHKAAQITPVPNANRPHSLCWSMKHKEWGRWVRFREKSDTAASWGQSHPLLRPNRRLHLRLLAALPPLAVLGPEATVFPWSRPSATAVSTL